MRHKKMCSEQLTRSIPKFLISFLLLSCLPYFSNALSTGAVGCEGGRPAVSGLHLSQNVVVTGPLTDDNIEFQINGIPLQPGVPYDLTLGVVYQWSLATQGEPFRGFLVRLGQGNNHVDTRDSLSVTNTTIAKLAETACIDAFLVGGVTHVNNEPKTEIQGTLYVHLPSQFISLDITVVVQNRDGLSVYYYSGFTLHVNPPPLNDGDDTVDASAAATTTKPTYTPYLPPPTAEPSTNGGGGGTSESMNTPNPTTQQPTTESPTTESPSSSPTTSPTPEPTPQPTAATQPPLVTAIPPPDVPIPPPTASSPIVTTELDLPPATPPIASMEFYAPPTDPPTTAPTKAPLPPTMYDIGLQEYDQDVPEQASELFLRYPACSLESPCGVCQGDCDTDDDCAGGLECFQRPQGDTSPVPGCIGEGVEGRDYCYLAQPNSLRPRIPECSPESPCPACYGDCDTDDDCLPGLQCFLRASGVLTPIFGCSGVGIAGLDYCYNVSAVDDAVAATLGDTTATVDRQDVDNPNAETVDVGVARDKNEDSLLVLREETKCDKNNPCTKCEGKCYKDDDCAFNLMCFRGRDEQEIPGCGAGSAGEHPGVNFCWDPDDEDVRHRLLRTNKRQQRRRNRKLRHNSRIAKAQLTNGQ